MQPRKHAIDLIVRSLQQSLHGAVFQVAYPAPNALQVRMTHRSHPETHALHTPADLHEQGFYIVLVMQRFNRCSPES